MKLKVFPVIAILLVALALASCSAIPLSSPAAAGPQPAMRSIYVTGSGRVSLAPDIAYINIGVNSLSENVSEALAQNNAQSEAVANALKELGVEAKDIQTSSFNIWPQQQYDPMGQVTGTKYSVDNTVYVTVRELSKLGQLLDAVVRSGANSINGIQFDVVEKEQARSEARKLAIDDANKQAQELAAVTGVKLGQLNSVSVSFAGDQPFYYRDGGYGGGMAVSAEVPISAGQIVVTANVSLTYEIE